MELDYESMVESGVYFGHQVRRWNPKFGPYLYKHVHGISIIDLERTHECLENAIQFLIEQVKEGADVLLVGTKPQAQELIRELGQAVNMPFCANRWLGGCLTNFETVKASLAKFKHFLAMEESGELNKLPKKESAAIRREMVRMQRSFEGIRNLEKRPSILFVVDATHEAIAIREARRLQIPVIGIVDTNSDPTVLDFPIPANDDSIKSLRVIFEFLQEAIQQGIELRKLSKSSHKDIPVDMVVAGEGKEKVRLRKRSSSSDKIRKTRASSKKMKDEEKVLVKKGEKEKESIIKPVKEEV